MKHSEQPLQEVHDLVMLDLDGVVYVSGEAVPGAPEHLAAAREAGARLAFVTNNAARTPDTVATHLGDLGVQADVDDVVTSAQAAAHLLLDRLGEGAAVFLLGGDGLRAALEERGLRAVTSADDEPVAVASGYGPDLTWGYIMSGAVLLADGLPWVASNTDATIPTAAGQAPGHGVLVDALARFADVAPTVAGKPERALFTETLDRMGSQAALMVGDRVDTDIVGATNAGVDSLLVMTGVTDLPALLGLGADQRPTYLAWDLGGLAETHGAPEQDGDGWALGGWTARVDGDEVVVGGGGEPGDWLRVVATAAWAHTDDGGAVPSAPQPPAVA